MFDTTCPAKSGLDAARARMRFAAVLATAIRELAEAQPVAPPRHDLPSRVALATNGAERR